MLHVGAVLPRDLASVIASAVRGWHVRRSFEMPNVLVLGPSKTGTTGYINCASGGLFSGTAERVVQVPKGAVVLGFGRQVGCGTWSQLLFGAAKRTCG